MNSGFEIVVVSAPSCAGKDTLVSALLRARPALGRVATTTTRPPRPGEVDGLHYHFRDPIDFRATVAGGGFVEYARVHAHLYGTEVAALDKVKAEGHTPLAILDVQGARSVAARMRALRIFVRAPLAQLEARIRRYRPPNEWPERIASARAEMDGIEADVVIDNPNGDEAAAAQRLMDACDRLLDIRPPTHAPCR